MKPPQRPHIWLAVTFWFSTVASQECPTNDLYSCENPLIVLPDPTIYCDPETCLWDLTLLDSQSPPLACQAVLLDERRIASVPDLLEPCLWWELLYGRFTALLPDHQNPLIPPPTSQPSAEPTVMQTTVVPEMELNATAIPTDWPTMEIMPGEREDEDEADESSDSTESPSMEVSEEVSEEATADPINANNGDSIPTQAPTLLPTTPTVSEPTGGPVRIEATNTPTQIVPIPVELASILLTFVFPSEQRLSQVDWIQSYSTLIEVTRQHIIGEIPDVHDCVLYLTRVVLEESHLARDQPVETVALTGTLFYHHFRGQPALDVRPNVVRRAVEEALGIGQGNERYIEALRTSSAPAIQRVQTVQVGLYTSIDQDPVNVPVEETAKDEYFWEAYWLQWDDPIWIIMVAAVGAGGLGIFLVVVVVCCVRCRRRRTEAKSPPIPQELTNPSEQTDEDVEQAKNHQDGYEIANRYSEDPYQASEVTSVYSYIDTGTMIHDDEEYSVTPSFLYPAGDYNPEDEQNRSVLWSVVDGITADMARANDDNGHALSPNANVSPSRMVVTTERSRKPNGEVMIFSDDDDDDDLSILSDRIVQPQAMDFNSLLDGESPYKNRGRAPDPKIRVAHPSVLPQRIPDSLLPAVDEGSKSSYSENTKSQEEIEDNSALNVSAAVRRSSSHGSEDDSMFLGPNEDLSKNVVPLSTDNALVNPDTSFIRLGPLVGESNLDVTDLSESLIEDDHVASDPHGDGSHSELDITLSDNRAAESMLDTTFTDDEKEQLGLTEEPPRTDLDKENTGLFVEVDDDEDDQGAAKLMPLPGDYRSPEPCQESSRYPIVSMASF